MTPRWISECKGFQMSLHLFTLDQFETLSVHTSLGYFVSKGSLIDCVNQTLTNRVTCTMVSFMIFSPLLNPKSPLINLSPPPLTLKYESP